MAYSSYLTVFSCLFSIPETPTRRRSTRQTVPVTPSPKKTPRLVFCSFFINNCLISLTRGVKRPTSDSLDSENDSVFVPRYVVIGYAI